MGQFKYGKQQCYNPRFWHVFMYMQNTHLETMCKVQDFLSHSWNVADWSVEENVCPWHAILRVVAETV